MSPSVTLLLGKPPKPGTLLDEVVAQLASQRCTVTVRLPHEEAVEIEDLADQTLVVHRGLHSAVAPLLQEAHARGVALCNPWPADRLLRDRRAWRDVLERAEIPQPPSSTVERWAGVLTVAEKEHVVAKSFAGPGRGVQVLAGTGRTLPGDAPFAGPYLVESRLASDGTDRKLYLAGDSVRGLLKPSTLEREHTTAGTPFQPDDELVDLAGRVRDALGAHVFGVDLIGTPSGPVVVDVNGFPGFRGVVGAARVVSEHLLAHAAA